MAEWDANGHAPWGLIDGVAEKKKLILKVTVI